MKDNKFKNEEFLSIDDSIDNMSIIFIGKINAFRRHIGKPMRILFNGATKGDHKSLYHPRGRALDFTCDTNDYAVIALAIKYGLNGIGMYTNHDGYRSWHLDDRPNITIWEGTKKNENDKWTYKTILGGLNG